MLVPNMLTGKMESNFKLCEQEKMSNYMGIKNIHLSALENMEIRHRSSGNARLTRTFLWSVELTV